MRFPSIRSLALAKSCARVSLVASALNPRLFIYYHLLNNCEAKFSELRARTLARSRSAQTNFAEAIFCRLKGDGLNKKDKNKSSMLVAVAFKISVLIQNVYISAITKDG